MPNHEVHTRMQRVKGKKDDKVVDVVLLDVVDGYKYKQATERKCSVIGLPIHTSSNTNPDDNITKYSSTRAQPISLSSWVYGGERRKYMHAYTGYNHKRTLPVFTLCSVSTEPAA